LVVGRRVDAGPAIGRDDRVDQEVDDDPEAIVGRAVGEIMSATPRIDGAQPDLLVPVGVDADLPHALVDPGEALGLVEAAARGVGTDRCAHRRSSL
jgi:hypothetical protein